MLDIKENTYRNTVAYKPLPGAKLVKLEVLVYLDPVPGWGDSVVDHVTAMMRNNPYIQEVQEIKE